MRKMLKGLVAGAALAFTATTAQAIPVELVTNGDFETGDFTGWLKVATGGAVGFAINDGTFIPQSGLGPTPPIGGQYDAVSDQGGPGTSSLLQTIALPGVFDILMLAWDDRIENLADQFLDPDQEFRVVFYEVSGAPIGEVFSTNPGDTLSQPGPNARSFDVTALLSAYAGQSIVLAFEEQDSLFFFNATIDNVSLTADIPEPATLGLLGAGLIGLGLARRRRRA